MADRQKDKYQRNANHSFFPIANIQRRILYCEVPKVASTNWKLMLTLTGERINSQEYLKATRAYRNNIFKSKNHHEFPVHNEGHLSRYDFKWLQNAFSDSQQKMIIGSYYKFLFCETPTISWCKYALCSCYGMRCLWLLNSKLSLHSDASMPPAMAWGCIIACLGLMPPVCAVESIETIYSFRKL